MRVALALREEPRWLKMKRHYTAAKRVLRRLQEEARIKGGNDTIVRLCIVGFGIAIASLAPVTWGWKIALFLVIMLLVGIIIPAIWRARQKSKISH